MIRALLEIYGRFLKKGLNTVLKIGRNKDTKEYFKR